MRLLTAIDKILKFICNSVNIHFFKCDVRKLFEQLLIVLNDAI